MVCFICARENSKTMHSLNPLAAQGIVAPWENSLGMTQGRKAEDLCSLTSRIFSGFLPLCPILLIISFLPISPRFLSDPAAGPGPGQRSPGLRRGGRGGQPVLCGGERDRCCLAQATLGQRGNATCC